MSTEAAANLTPYKYTDSRSGKKFPSYRHEPSFTAAIRDDDGTHETGLGFDTYTDVIEYLYYEQRLGPDREGIVTNFHGPSFTIRFADRYQED